MISSVFRKGWILALIIFISVLLAGCNAQTNSPRIDLTNDWEYALTENDVRTGSFSDLKK